MDCRYSLGPTCEHIPVWGVVRGLASLRRLGAHRSGCSTLRACATLYEEHSAKKKVVTSMIFFFFKKKFGGSSATIMKDSWKLISNRNAFTIHTDTNSNDFGSFGKQLADSSSIFVVAQII